jgi:DNA invertase Pin-like site-specific DNA recombinase
MLEKMIDFVREGDTIYIHDFSRIARSTKDLLNIIEQLNEKGVNLVSNKEHLDCSTATGKLMLTVIAAINQFERENMLERQREGIAIAKREGKYKAHNKVVIEPERWREAYERHMRGEICIAELSRELEISRPTAYKLIRQQEKAASQ